MTVCGAPAGSRGGAPRRSATSPSCSASPAGARPTRCWCCTSGWRAATGGAAERARAARRSSASATRRRGAWRRCARACSSALGIAQALIGAPQLLLLDEPTSALDPAGRRTVRDLLVELRRRGVAVLLNTHLLSEVEHVCDRVAIIDRGELVAAGSPAELASGRAAWRSRSRRGTRRLRGRDARRRAADRRRARRRPASRSTACASLRSTLEDAYLDAVGARVRGPALVVARHALRESLRRRVFAVVLG